MCYKSNKVIDFSEFLSTLKFGNEYKEPEFSEEVITEEDVVIALKEIGVKDSERVLRECKEVIDKNKSIIEKNYLQNREEAILIISYTYEEKLGKELPPYRIINKKLWESDIEDQLINKKSYLRLLLRTLRKLPRTKSQTLYRGIRGDKKEYKNGEEIEWKGFSSTTTSMKATVYFLKNEKTGKVEGTLFEIRNAWGYDIHEFSDYTYEEGAHKKYLFDMINTFY